MIKKLIYKLGVKSTGSAEAYFQRKLYNTLEHVVNSQSYNYEPIKANDSFFESERDWQSRWKSIQAVAEEYEVTSVTDIGCAEGWFIRRLSEDLNCFTIGVETIYNRILAGELSRLHDRVRKTAIIEDKIGPEEILKLPTCDMILCLSVVHHIIRKNGVDEGREFVKAIGRNVKKVIIFEMGTENEKLMQWASNMPSMPEGQAAFIKEFLESAGLKNVREIGHSPSIKKDDERMLFAAEPSF